MFRSGWRRALRGSKVYLLGAAAEQPAGFFLELAEERFFFLGVVIPHHPAVHRRNAPR